MLSAGRCITLKKAWRINFPPKALVWVEWSSYLRGERPHWCCLSAVAIITGRPDLGLTAWCAGAGSRGFLLGDLGIWYPSYRCGLKCVFLNSHAEVVSCDDLPLGNGHWGGNEVQMGWREQGAVAVLCVLIYVGKETEAGHATTICRHHEKTNSF